MATTCSETGLRRGVAVATLIVSVSSAIEARGQGVAARLVDRWATRGEPVSVEAIVDDDVGVVDRVVFDLAIDGDWIETATVTQPPWIATFPAEAVWPRDPSSLDVRARLLGQRGGVVLELGVPFAPSLEIVEPAEGARRRAELARAVEPPDPFPVEVVVAAEGRVGSASRARIHLAVLGPVAPRAELKLGLSVGPRFAPPDRLDGGGPLVLGSEIGARWSATRLWFVDAVATADVRFPGFDPGGALFVGARGPWGNVGWEASAGGGALAADVTEGAHAVFFGVVRLGVRFGSTGSEDGGMKEP